MGKNEEFTDTIFKAYFEDCVDIGKDEVIINLARKIGLTKKDVENALEDPLLQKTYANNCAEARKRNITGVPTFIINDEYTIVGAQPEQTFVELFEKIEKEITRWIVLQQKLNPVTLFSIYLSTSSES